MATEGFVSYSVDNDRRFRNAIDKAREEVGDLRIPLTLIAKDFYRSEKAIFQLKGPGQYPDLADSTKARKYRKFGDAYPILKATGRLEASVTDPTHEDAINLLVGKSALIIGTRVAYGVFHQSDRARKKIPLRKFLFIGPESTFANSDQRGRLERWINIVNGYLAAKLKQKGGA